jgi:hypothetical protein
MQQSRRQLRWLKLVEDLVVGRRRSAVELCFVAMLLLMMMMMMVMMMIIVAIVPLWR